MTLFRKTSAMVVSGLLLAQTFATASAATPPAQGSANAPARTSRFAGKTPTKSVPFTASKDLTTALQKVRNERLNLDKAKAAAAKKLEAKKAGVSGFVPGDGVARATQYKADDIVRVIVEMQGQSAAEKAAANGQRLQTADASLARTAEAEAATQRDSVVSAARGAGVSLKLRHTFGVALKGFSADMRFGDLQKLQETAGVKRASVAQEYMPLDNSATEMVGAQNLWNLDPAIDGTGTTIAIIDTGVDYRHGDLGGQSKLDPAGKVIGGWNFADNSSQVLDFSGSGHGTHVAGIAAATGEGPQHIKGMAPKAKIIAQKVFSNEGATKSAWTDDLVAAIDDAVNKNSKHHLGVAADVLNMSLGSVSGFADATDPEQKAIANATNAGALSAISAGNSSYNTSSIFYPFYWNQDVATNGSPGTAPEAITVASSQNAMLTIQGRGVLATINGAKYNGGSYTVYLDGSGKSGAFQTLGGSSLSVAIPSGSSIGCNASDWSGQNLAGKVALIKRGSCTFQLKTDYATAAGAKAVIVYNNLLDPDITAMAVDAAKVPSVMVMNSFGTELYNAVDDGQDVKVSFNGQVQKLQVADPKSDTISSFSSWGTTPDLGFKPDVTAPGGNIYSTIPNGQYGPMNGTSMAAPHVAGAAALIKQAHPSFTPVDIKAALMNTSKVLNNPANGSPYSPRQQGAGRIQVDQAVATNVVATVNNKPSVALGAVPFGSATPFTLTLTNNGADDATFDLSGSVFAPTQNGPFNWMTTSELAGAAVTFGNTTVTVPADDSIEVAAVLDLSGASRPSAALFGHFAEGYITLASQTEGQPNLSVPYISYVGEWVGPNAPPIVDTMNDDGNCYTCMTGLYAPVGGTTYNALGYSFEGDFYSDKMAISTDATVSTQTTVSPALTLLRNAQNMVIEVLNDNGQVVDKIASEQNMRNIAAAEYYLGNWKWDGKTYDRTTGKRKAVDDGQYHVRVRTLSPGANAADTNKWQNFEMPLVVDSVTPEVELYSNVPTVGGKYTLEWDAWDYETGVYGVVPIMDGKPAGDMVSGHDWSTEINIPSGTHKDIGVCAFDYAGNQSCYAFYDPVNLNGITAVGDLKITTNKPTVQLAYTIAEPIVHVTWQEGESEAEAVALNAETGRPETKINVNFSKDGVAKIIVKAYTDEAGTELAGEITYTVDVDMTPPVLDFTSPEARSTTSNPSVLVKGSVSEAHPKAGAIQYSLDEGKTWKALVLDKDNNFNFTAVLTGKGRHNLMFKAEDALGNVTELARAVYIDGAAPTITTAFDPATGKAPANIDVLVTGWGKYSLKGTTADDASIYTFSADGAPQYTVDTLDPSQPHDWSYDVNIVPDLVMPYAKFMPIPSPTVEVKPVIVSLKAEDISGAATQRTVTFKSTAHVITDLNASDNVVTRKMSVSAKVTSDVTGVKVNGVSATIKNGAFQVDVARVAGWNDIVVVATTKDVARVGLAFSAVYAAPFAITAPADGAMLQATEDGIVTVKGVVDPAYKDTITFNEAPIANVAANGSFSVAVETAGDGEFTYTVAVPGEGVGADPISRDYSFTYDGTSPVVNVGPFNEGAYKDSVAVAVTVSDTNLSSLTVNGKAVSIEGSGTYAANVDYKDVEGVQEIVVIATDKAGNATRIANSVMVDAKAPELKVNLVDGNAYSSPVTVSGTVKDANLVTEDMVLFPDALKAQAVTPGSRYIMVNGEQVTVAADGSFTTTVTIEGATGTITVQAEDTVGHVTQKAYRVTVSRALKSLTLSPGERWSPTVGKLTVKYEMADTAVITLGVYDKSGTLKTSLYSGKRTPGAYTATWDGKLNGRVVDGEYDIVLAAGSAHLSVPTTVVSAKPENPTITTEAQTSNADTITIRGTAPGATSVVITVSGPSRINTQTVPVNGGVIETAVKAGNTFEATFDMKAAGAKDGVYAFSAVGKDDVGNQSAKAATVKITRKAAAPTKPTISDLSKVVTGTSVSFTVRTGEVGTLTIANDNLAMDQLNYAITKTTTKVTLPLAESMPDGQYDFTAWMTDAAGNKSADTKFTFVLDRTKPALEITSAATGAKGKSYQLTGKVSDANGIATVTVNGSKVTPKADGTFMYMKALSSQAGTVTKFTVVVTDKAGNVYTEIFSVTAN